MRRFLIFRHGLAVFQWARNLSGFQFTKYFNSFVLADTNQLFSRNVNVIYVQKSAAIRDKLMPVAGLFLMRLGFEKIFKTQGIFKIKERFQVMLEYFKYFRIIVSTLLGSKNPRNFQKSRDFLEVFQWGLYFSCFFFERTVQIMSTNLNRGGFIEPRSF